MADKSYADIAIEYAEQVTAGDIVAGKFVILACRRFLDDLARQDSDDFPYLFNPVLTDMAGRDYLPADRICAFTEMLPHVKGQWARRRELIKLESWQIFILANVYGWIHRDTLARRFRTAYNAVARKNAKTTLACGPALYALVYDDEIGAEVYSAATTADQSAISWTIAKQMVAKSPGMQNRFGVHPFAHSIAVEETGSFFKYLSSDSKGLDGTNTHFALIDELHAHKTREVFDVMETSTGAREQPIIFIITTAGTNLAGICYEQESYLKKILNGIIHDETYFGMIYTIDDGDDWTNPEIWIKANPNLGVSVDLADIARLCKKAQEMPSATNNFLTKRLNVWCNADSAWMDLQALKRCRDPELKILDFAGEVCRPGLDLASSKDIAARMRLFVRNVDGVSHYYAFGTYYLPKLQIEIGANDLYSGWARSKLLTVTPGNIIDYDAIESDLKADKEIFEIPEVVYDPFQATQLAVRMQGEGFEMVQIGATVKNFSEPMKFLEAIILDGRFHYNDDILEWMFSNVVAHLDKKDNIFPNKERAENKIDGVVALIMVLSRVISEDIPKPSVYKKRGLISLAG